MKYNKILKVNSKLLSKAKIINTNAPKFVHFPLLINGQKPKLLVCVQQEVTCGQVLAELEGTNLKIISSVNGRVIEIKEKQNKDESYSLNIKIENNFNKELTLKKLINPSVEILKNRMLEAGIIELATLDNTAKIAIYTTDTKHNLGLNAKIFDVFFKQVLKGAQLIKKTLELSSIYLVVNKQNYEKTLAEVQKLNLTGIVVLNKIKAKKIMKFGVQTALDFYDAVSNGTFRTEHFIAVAGQSIKSPNYYLVKIGTTLAQLIELSGGLKHTYPEIEAFKEQALLALNDELQLKDEIKEEKDSEKKAKLKLALQEKKLETKNQVFKYFKENQKKFSLCLSNMVIVENKKLYSATSPDNVINERVTSVLFLANCEYKNKQKYSK